MQNGEVGDRLIVESEHVGQPPREGEILEVLGDGQNVHYAVRWEDGHKSTFFPSLGSSSILKPKGQTAPRPRG